MLSNRLGIQHAFRLCSTAGLPPLGLLKLRDLLDARIIGQHELKDAMVLALVGREHLYVEGPPGTAKTLLAETAAHAAGLQTFVYQLHRDTRLHELVGDTVIMREHGGDGAETIRHALRPGGILTAEVAVLDDISRAPGEALNVLFRVLNERRFCMDGGDVALPLVTAIATGNPCGGVDEYYAEPLDPASLDRFTLQVRASGLIETSTWDDALRVIAVNSGGNKDDLAMSDASEVAAALVEAHASLPEVVFGEDLQRLLVQLLQALLTEIETTGTPGRVTSTLLTDRTFLAKAPVICRVHAIVQGRMKCIDADLYAIRHLTTFRVPPQIHERIEEIIDGVINAAREMLRKSQQEGTGNEGGTGSGEPRQAPASEPQVTAGESPPSTSSDSKKDCESAAAESEIEHMQQEEGASRPQHSWRYSDIFVLPVLSVLGALEALLYRCAGHIQQAKGGASDSTENLTSDKHVVPLLSAISGRMQRSARKRKTIFKNGCNIPRGWRVAGSMHDLGACEVDAVEAWQWARQPTPALPRVIARHGSSRRGGRLAIIRDVSASMEGANAVWASAVVSHVVDMCRKRSLSVGYLEFNHEPIPLRVGSGEAVRGEFFTRDYDKVRNAALHTWGDGGTNMQFALRATLSEYARVPQALVDIDLLRMLGQEMYNGRLRGRAKSNAIDYENLKDFGIFLPSEDPTRQQVPRSHQTQSSASHALLVTDGVPTLGCASLTAERAEARSLGVCVHTVFIGAGADYPDALSDLSEATGGVRFQAVIDPSTGNVMLSDCGQL